LSTPVVVLRVKDDTLPSLKLVTNASAPVPLVGVAVGVLEPLPLTTGRRPLLFVHDTVLSVAAIITIAGISRTTFLSAIRPGEKPSDSLLRSHAIPFSGQSGQKTTAS